MDCAESLATLKKSENFNILILHCIITVIIRCPMKPLMKENFEDIERVNVKKVEKKKLVVEENASYIC